jgi:glycosyltransferase involved in cell wall biosynthesis
MTSATVATPPPRGLVLALLASDGLGGGIERYADGVLEAIGSLRRETVRVAVLEPGLSTPSALNKVRFVRRVARAALRHRRSGVEVMVFHPSLLPVGLMARRLLGAPRRPTVFVYGQDSWALGRCVRWLLRAGHARVVTISSFTSGALSPLANAAILAPGVTEAWWRQLSSMPRVEPGAAGRPLRVVSVFRLAESESKGARQLIAAVEQVRQTAGDVRLDLVGSGPAPDWLHRETSARSSWLTVTESPPDDELAKIYAAGSVFALATRTRSRQPLSGEGFGIVLVEAQLAGLPVVAPAYGGSADAFLPGITGWSPPNESSDALAEILRWFAINREGRQRMATSARAWATTTFAPAQHRRRVSSLLGDAPAPIPSDVVITSSDPTVSDPPQRPTEKVW